MKSIFSTIEVHKYYINPLILLVLVIFLCNTIWSATSKAGTQIELSWSFDEHPHPQEHMLTHEEKLIIETAESEGRAGFCERSLETKFQIYNARYPEFAQNGDNGARFLAWKRYLASDRNNLENFCIRLSAANRILDAKYNTDLIFCGVFSLKPETPLEQAFAEAVEELISYVGVGNLAAMHELLYHHRPGTIVSLNPDVELYIRKYAYVNTEFDRHEGTWYTDHLEPLLTPQRIAFVDDAVERGDFRAVLETTSACPTRQQ